MWGAKTFEDEIRLKKPGKAMAADHGSSRAKAIELKCESCAGSLTEAKKCTVQTCFLFPYRPGRGARNEGVVPTVEEYRVFLPELTDEEKEAVRRQLQGGGEDA